MQHNLPLLSEWEYLHDGVTERVGTIYADRHNMFSAKRELDSEGIVMPTLAHVKIAMALIGQYNDFDPAKVYAVCAAAYDKFEVRVGRAASPALFFRLRPEVHEGDGQTRQQAIREFFATWAPAMPDELGFELKTTQEFNGTTLKNYVDFDGAEAWPAQAETDDWIRVWWD